MSPGNVGVTAVPRWAVAVPAPPGSPVQPEPRVAAGPRAEVPRRSPQAPTLP